MENWIQDAFVAILHVAVGRAETGELYLRTSCFEGKCVTCRKILVILASSLRLGSNAERRGRRMCKQFRQSPRPHHSHPRRTAAREAATGSNTAVVLRQ